MMRNRAALGFLVMLLAFAADQLSKWYVLVAMTDRPPLYVAPFFDLVLVWNRGISFGMLAGRNQPIFLTVLSLVIVLLLARWLLKMPPLRVAMALGSVMGGAVGNVVDRLRFGAVEDFLDFHMGIYHWPAFNVADSLIFIGVVLLCLDGMLRPKQPEGSPQ